MEGGGEVSDTPRVDAIITGNSDVTNEEYEDLAYLARALERRAIAAEAFNKQMADVYLKASGELQAKLRAAEARVKELESDLELWKGAAESWNKDCNEARSAIHLLPIALEIFKIYYQEEIRHRYSGSMSKSNPPISAENMAFLSIQAANALIAELNKTQQ